MKFLLERLDFLNEASLGPKEIRKYDYRAKIFIKKIENNEPFILNDGSSVFLDKEKNMNLINRLLNSSDDLINPKTVVVTKNGEKLALSKFKKTKEFGGEVSGAGGGSENTDLTESAQCLYASVAFNVIKGKISEKDLTNENFEKASEFITVTAPYENMLNKISPDWIENLIQTANKLFETFKFKSNVYFHRGDDFMNSIYQTKTISLKKTYNQKITNDKWNPSDIWMTIDNNVINEIKKITNFDILNKTIKKLFNENKLIGISLKKINIKSGPVITYYNKDNNDKKIEKISRIKIFDKEFYMNKDIYIFAGGKKIQFRTFSNSASYQAEIKGKTAAGGKCGLGIINTVLSKFKIKPVLTPVEVLAIYKKDLNKFNSIFYDFYNNNLKELSKYSVEKLKMYKFDEFSKFPDFASKGHNNKKLDFIVSKFISMNLIDTLLNNKQKADEIITEIINYASSSSSFSSTFIKIH